MGTHRGSNHMKPRSLADVVALMQPSETEVFGGGSVVVGPDVVIDSRAATPGCLFVAIPGERVDGHDFAAAAAALGAAAVLGTRAGTAQVPHIICPDSVTGLSHLARGVVAEARARGMVSIGVTGSSGKTSTKDLLAQVLESAGPTVSPVGSQNNEIGVPLTACRVDPDTRFLVSEMGARGIGHIAWLTSLVGLDVGVVLNIGTAHVGEFGDKLMTAAAKGELVEGLPHEGWAVLNADDPLVAGMAARTRAGIAWFGEGDLPEGALQVRARGVQSDALSRHSFDLVATREGRTVSAPVQLQVIGRHQVSNALAAAAAALAVGMDVDAVATALSSAGPRSKWRMELHRRTDDVVVLNDAYNANPDSVAAALRTAVEIGRSQRARHADARVLAVLGDMLELGPDAALLHATTGRLAADLGVDLVVAVGDLAAALADGAVAGGAAALVSSRESAAEVLGVRPGDVILVKGSRGVGLEMVAAQLLEGEVT